MTFRHSRTRSLAFLGLLLFTLAAMGLALASGAAAGAPPSVPDDGSEPLPPGATIETLLPGMNFPIAMAFDPAGRLFYTEKTSGQVRLFANGTLQPAPVITFSVTGSGEQGLLGITVDPNFNTNHYIYVFYTCSCTPRENRVVRFVENNGVGSDPTTIFTSPNDTSASNHNGGNIHFGPDGKLYISLGDDGATPSNSQNVQVKQGKIHRINSDGTIPGDNPVFTQTGALPSLYAMGLRNSFDFTFDPYTTGRIFASENGPGCDDEINRIEPGYNYGWRPSYPCDDANPSPTFNTIPPLWFLGTGSPYGGCCTAPTGAEVYDGSQIAQWTGGLFMATYSDSALHHFYLNADRTLITTANIVQGVSVGTDLETGPDGALWYIQGGGYTQGTLKRIVGTGGSTTPTPAVTNTATRTSTAIVLTSTATRTPTSVQPTNTVGPTATGSATSTVAATSTPVCPGPPAQVNIESFDYFPRNLTVAVGATVNWTNLDPSIHTATSCTDNQGECVPDGRFDTGNIAQNQSRSITFTQPGVYQYLCSPHPFMLATITVVESAGCSTATPPVVATNTATATMTNTPMPGITNTATPAVTNTAMPGVTGTSVVTNTSTSTPIATGVATSAPSSTPTRTTQPNATPTVCLLRFMDVPSTNTFYDVVLCLACRGVINGYPCGTVTSEPCNGTRDPYFRPNNNITRGQIAKIVSESAGLMADPGAPVFEDVPATSTFYQWINRLSQRGYMGGYPCGGANEPCGVGNKPYFRPFANATRGQLAKIVSNAALFAEPQGGQTFTDVPTDSPFHLWIERLATRGVMGGYECGRPTEPCDAQQRPYFRPNNDVTRGQASKIVSNTFFPNCRSVTPAPTSTVLSATNTPVPPTSTSIPQPTGTPSVSDVRIENFDYLPTTLTVTVGSTVRWTNYDLDYHTSTSCTPNGEGCTPNGVFDTGRINQNESRSITFATPGTYEYLCLPHPYMRAIVNVVGTR